MEIDENLNLHAVCTRINEVRIGTDLPVRFNAFEVEQVGSIVAQSVSFTPGIAYADKPSLIGEAIAAAASRGRATPENLRNALRRVESRYLALPFQRYVLVSSLSLSDGIELHRRNIRGATITFGALQRDRFDRAPLQRYIQDLRIPVQRFMPVRIAIESRTANAALIEANDAIDYLRAFWNFGINRRTLSRTSVAGGRSPVNKIRKGALATLHHPGGQVATDSCWYEPPPQNANRVLPRGHEWDRATAWETSQRELRRKHPYHDDLDPLLIRYCRALDSSDFEVSFLKLWSVLEHLTGTVGQNYDELVRRASFILTPVPLARQLLHHLRAVRNGLVHHDSAVAQMEAYLYQVKWVTENMFRFHLAHGRLFGSLGKASEFLHSPSDPAALEERIRGFKTALQMQRRWRGR